MKIFVAVLTLFMMIFTTQTYANENNSPPRQTIEWLTLQGKIHSGPSEAGGESKIIYVIKEGRIYIISQGASWFS